MTSFRDRIREGAAEVLGIEDVEPVKELLAERESRLTEASADARMLARSIEDVDWNNIGSGNQENYIEPTPATRRQDVREAYLYYFNDPIVGRTVDLKTNYAFAKGIRKPKYRDDIDNTAISEGPGQEIVDAFWTDPFNQKVLFGVEAQRQKSTELQLQANIFILILDPEDQTVLRGAGAVPNVPVRLADLPEQEIVDVIMHPGNRKIPLFYKRSYTPRSYDFTAGTYQPGVPTVAYYRDWRFTAPTIWDGQPWGPDPSQIADGLVYHLAVNRTSAMKFGVPEVKRYIKWARGLNEYMHARMNLVQALAQLAYRAKVRGGPRHVAQVAGTLQQLSKVAQTLEGTTDLTRPQASQGQTRVSVENSGVDLEPMVTDTNSGNAANDINTIKSQVSAGSGVPAHHLGGTGDANLASATSMDAPLQRLCEAWQELWEGLHRDLCSYTLRKAGQDPAMLDTQMPPILSRDIAVISQVVIGLIGAVDPNVSNRNVVRWCVGQVLDTMGVDNVNELLDQFFPADWVSPMEQTLMIGQAQAAMAGGGAPGGGLDAANAGAIGAQADEDSGSPSNTSQFDDGMLQHAQAIRRGRRMAGVTDGPQQAGQDSRDRAQKRHDRSLVTPAEAEPMTRQERIAWMIETMTDDGVEPGEALAVLSGMNLPPELREVGQAAISALSVPNGDDA